MRLSKGFMVALMTGMLSGCISSGPQYLSRPEALSSTGTFTHDPSGLTFPIAVGDFQRVDIYQFDVEGENIGVTYQLTDDAKPVTVSVYVYPSPSIVSLGSPESVTKSAQATLCQQEFETTKQEIMAARTNASHLESDTSGGIQNLLARFEYEEAFAGKQQRLSSILELSCYMDDQWNIKYRVTYPSSVEVQQELQQLQTVIEDSDSTL